jgi:hypothetical protein
MVKVSPLQAKMGPLSHSLSILSTESGGKGKGKMVCGIGLDDRQKKTPPVKVTLFRLC